MKIGFIGMGNMGKALVKGIIKGGKIKASDVFAFAPNQEKLKASADEVGFTLCHSNKELAEKSDLVIMACKPNQVEEVLKEIKPEIKGKAILSVAAAWDFDRYYEILGDEIKIQCIMPNIPVQILQGVIVAEEKNSLDKELRKELFDILRTCSLVLEVPTENMEVAGSISGCGPAFVEMIIEALGDGGVKNGLKRDMAYQLACQTLIGASALTLETGKHPGKLKDEVCSPGGITIKGVACLENHGIRSAFIEAVDVISGNK